MQVKQLGLHAWGCREPVLPAVLGVPCGAMRCMGYIYIYICMYTYIGGWEGEQETHTMEGETDVYRKYGMIIHLLPVISYAVHSHIAKIGHLSVCRHTNKAEFVRLFLSIT